MAANRIKGITIEIDGNTTKLQEALKDVNKQLKDTQSDLKDIDKLLKLDPKNTELLTQKHEMLSKAVGDTKEKLDKLKEAQAQMNASGVDKSSAEYQALSREIIDCEQSLKRLDQAARESNVTLQKVAASGQKLKSAGDAISSVGQQVSKASAVVATGMGAAVKITMDFDAQMSKVKAISGATESEFEQLRNKAREMGAQTKFSATESAQAFEYMAMAGWKTGDMLEGIEGIMNLAAASGADLATTSDIVTDALTAFGMEAKDSGKFADILAAAATNSNTNVEMMGETFKYAAPLFGSMGYSAEDAAVAIGLMGNAGIKATNAGTALRGILTRLAKPTKESAEAIETLGIELDDGQGNMLPFMDIMKQMRAGFGELKITEDELNESMAMLDSNLEDGTISQKEYDESVSELMQRAYGAEGALKAESAAMLAGKNALSGLLAIVNASDEDFNKLTTAIYGADGTAQSMANTMQDNLAGQLTVLKSQLQELAISFGDILMPTIRKVVEWLQGLVDKFNGMSEGQKKVITVIGLIIVALGPLLLIVGNLISLIGQVMIFMPMIVGAAAPVVGAITAFMAPLWGVIAAIVAVIAAIDVWVKHWDDIKQATILLGEIIHDWYQDTIQPIFDKVKEKIDALKKAWDMFKEIFEKVVKPNIKMPKLKVEGSLDLFNIPPKVPKVKLDWFKKAYDDAYLLNSPTIFGASGGKLLAGGEGNGSEAVVGTDKLMSMMQEAVGNTNVTVVLEGDANGVFNLVRTETSRFVKSNGYSPLMG